MKITLKGIIFTLILLPFFSNAQTFNLSDTSFKVGDTYRAHNILFGLDKPTIRTESYPPLDSIADFLLKNKELVIEVSNHRDNRNPKQYEKISTNLTMARAQSIVKYLTLKGIDPTRLIAKGYGAVKPINSDEEIKKLNTKEEIENAHQQNRRTEFKIIQTDSK